MEFDDLTDTNNTHWKRNKEKGCSTLKLTPCKQTQTKIMVEGEI